jgi:hypothetical protein
VAVERVNETGHSKTVSLVVGLSLVGVAYPFSWFACQGLFGPDGWNWIVMAFLLVPGIAGALTSYGAWRPGITWAAIPFGLAVAVLAFGVAILGCRYGLE